jgi:VanZ family protein
MQFSRKTIWFIIFSWALVIFILSSIPNPPQPVTGDELFLFILTTTEHIIEYAILGFLLFYGFTSLGNDARFAIILAIIFAAAYGATDEIHQYYVPTRECSILDLAADTLGGAIGALAASWIPGLLRKQSAIKLKPRS